MDPRAIDAEARAYVAARKWDSAAVSYGRLAEELSRAGDRDGARAAWDAAGECFRRADRPVAAARALRIVLADPHTPAPGGLFARVKLAGVYAEIGELGRASSACRRVLSEAPEGLLGAMAADTLAGVLESQGHKEEARALLPLLAGDPRIEAARRFREGQLARLDGRLDDALAHADAVIAALTGVEGAEGGIAAARGERAEVALLRGHPAEALPEFAASAAEHEAAGRQSMRWRAEAGRVRASVEAGLVVLAGLDDGIGLALERGMAPLAIDLRIARGMARAARDPAGAAADLDRAAADGDALGLPFKAGRARLERATRVPASAAWRIDLLSRALADLADHVPLATRARAALASARGKG